MEDVLNLYKTETKYMQDQAVRLRNIVRDAVNDNTNAMARVVAVTSGKGGVGKSNMSTNLALAMTKFGKKVLLIDFDLGLANIDILFGIYPQYTLKDVFRGNKELKDVIVEGPEGLLIIPASSGVEDMVNLSLNNKERLVRELSVLKKDIDIVIVDTGSGIYSDVVKMLLAANEVIIIATPEPTSITDAYAVIKVLAGHKKGTRIKLLINMCRDIADARNTGKKIAEAAKRFLNVEIREVWAVPFDQQVSKAVRSQRPFLLQYPDAAASLNIRKIAGSILSAQAAMRDEQDVVGVDSYFDNIMNA